MSEQFVVSARKYRPMRFEDVVGQRHVWQTLKNAISTQHLAQAFLFCGPRGVGKTTCARILAKVLNCLQPTSDTEPCDTCAHCAAFRENASLNVYELDAASNNSVEHIRGLIEQVRFAPQQGRYKIYIIDEVHMLSQAAFNAFLKTLEEPPSYAIFILATTEKHKILPTILSRCQIFEFNRIQIQDMVDHLGSIAQREHIEADLDALNIIAQKADGGLRDALSIFDRVVSYAGNRLSYDKVIEQLNILDYSYYFQVVEAMLAENWPELLLLFDKVLRKGFEADLFINGLAEHLRNLLFCQDVQTAELMELSGNIRERYLQQAFVAPAGFLLTALNLCNECDIHYKLARNKRYHVELYLLKMAHIRRALQYQGLPAANATEEKKKPELSPAMSQQLIAPVSLAQEQPLQTEPPKTKSKFADRLQEKKTQALQIDKLKAELQREAEAQAEKPSLPLNEANLKQFWESYTQEQEATPSVFVVFKGAVLSLPQADNPKLIPLKVGSPRGKELIEKDRALLERLRQTFGDGELNWLIDIEAPPPESIAPPAPARPVTDRDKYKHLLQKNPLLKDLQSKFKLLPPNK